MKIVRWSAISMTCVMLLLLILVNRQVEFRQARLESEAVAIRQSFIEEWVASPEDIVDEDDVETELPEEESSQEETASKALSDVSDTVVEDEPPPLTWLPDSEKVNFFPVKTGWDYLSARLELSAMNAQNSFSRTRELDVVLFLKHPSICESVIMKRLESGIGKL